MLTTKTLTLPHPLTEDEVLAAYDRAHDIDEEADALAEQLKTETAARKETIRKLRSDAKRRRVSAAARTEQRSVLCTDELRGSQVITIRNDTGEIVDERAATPADQQASFPGLELGPDHVAAVLPIRPKKGKRAKLTSVAPTDDDETTTPPVSDEPDAVEDR